MKLIVGLGNPGGEYRKTRHNVGFIFLNSFLSKEGISLDKKKFKGEYIEYVSSKGNKAILLEPQTYMNLSGDSIIDFVRYFKIDVENVLVKNLLTSDYQKVELEDVEFNKTFSVYTTNQIEARYALTTSMMDRLLQLNMIFKSKYIRASFKNGKLVLAIQSDKDLFKLGTVWPCSMEKISKEMFAELISILKITDALNLNSDTGL